ncbi:MAG: hypothetical protein JKX85_14600 [Phycisphaeraceae bacterium]|nr:hypothetical protein [Phycisphaeraceae bacterium]
MSKFFVVFAVALACFLSTQTFAQDQIFMMETYAAKVEVANGTLTIDSNGLKVMQLLLMTFNNYVEGKNTRIWPPRSGGSPQIQVTQKGNNTLISISYDKPGLIQNFQKTILLMPDSIAIETSLTPLRTFSSCSSGLELFPDVFSGAKYTAINRKKTVSGYLPKEAPTNKKSPVNGLRYLSEITFTKTQVGTVSFTFSQKNLAVLSDLRAVGWSKKYKLSHSKVNYPAGKKLESATTLKISPKNKAIQKVQTTAISPAKILFDLDFENGFDAKAQGNPSVQNKNTPKIVEGIRGHAVQFEHGQVLQYIESKNLDKRKGSLSFWVKASDILDPNVEIYKTRYLFSESGKARSGSNIFKFAKGTWGALRFDLRDKSNSYWSVYEFYNWENNQWHHVTLTWNNKKGVTIYVDGQVKQSAEQHTQKRSLLPIQWHALPAKHFFIGAMDKKERHPDAARSMKSEFSTVTYRQPKRKKNTNALQIKNSKSQPTTNIFLQVSLKTANSF